LVMQTSLCHKQAATKQARSKALIHKNCCTTIEPKHREARRYIKTNAA